MKYLDPSEQVLVPVFMTVRGDTARLLTEMAKEIGVSLDELLSGIAEDAVIGLEEPSPKLDDVVIPNSTNAFDLLRYLSNE